MEKTLGDRLISTYQNYLAPSKKKPKSVGKKERQLINTGNYGREGKYQGYDKLTPNRRREIASESPLFMKGVRKKSMDTFRAWFSVKSTDSKKEPLPADLKAFEDFERRSNIRSKATLARIASHIYGDGYLLITFLNDEGMPLDSEPAENSEPFNASVLNSEYINEIDSEGFYIYQKGMDEAKRLHPSRIVHFKANALPGFRMGVSTVDLLRWTLKSKKNIDIAAGEILSWFAHGLIDLKWENMTPEERKAMEKLVATHPGAYIHDQDVEVDVKNPTSIDPQPFYDYVVLNIAGALNMPTHILTGVQIGRVTGAEIGYSDYYRDVKDEQYLECSPLFVDLYSRILKARGRKWNYDIEWNPIYIDEMSEAKLLELKINSANKAYNGNNKQGQGFISKEEARMIINQGQIKVDASEDVSPAPLPKPEITPPTNPHKPPQPSVKPLKTIKKSVANQAMIDRWKELRKKQMDEIEERLFGEESVQDTDNGN